MTTSLTARASMTVNASAAATAWLNAFLATGQDEERPILYATLAVEFFDEGVHFIACDGTMLFRTWVPKHGTESDWPKHRAHPDAAVVVMDGGHFALAFIRQLLTASKAFEAADLVLSIEDAPEQGEEIALGAEFSSEVLTLRGFGQQLHCRLYEAPYVDWRALKFGLEEAERVDGMKLATRMFAAVGKLRSIGAIECKFTGDEKHIVLRGDRSFRGVLMPMARPKKEAPEPSDDGTEQTDALAEDTKVKVDGRWVPATEANVAKALGQKRGGRDRATGREE